MKLYADILTEVIARLNYQLQAGRLLAGFKVQPYPRVETIGLTDLPEVRMFLPTAVETQLDGGPALANVTVRLLVATQRKQGVPALAEAVGRVLDAVGRDTSNRIDPFLSGQLAAPFVATWQGGEAEDVSITAELLLSMTAAKAPCHGERSI